MTNIQRNDLS